MALLSPRAPLCRPNLFLHFILHQPRQRLCVVCVHSLSFALYCIIPSNNTSPRSLTYLAFLHSLFPSVRASLFPQFTASGSASCHTDNLQEPQSYMGLTIPTTSRNLNRNTFNGSRPSLNYASCTPSPCDLIASSFSALHFCRACTLWQQFHIMLCAGKMTIVQISPRRLPQVRSVPRNPPQPLRRLETHRH